MINEFALPLPINHPDREWNKEPDSWTKLHLDDMNMGAWWLEGCKKLGDDHIYHHMKAGTPNKIVRIKKGLRTVIGPDFRPTKKEDEASRITRRRMYFKPNGFKRIGKWGRTISRRSEPCGMMPAGLDAI